MFVAPKEKCPKSIFGHRNSRISARWKVTKFKNSFNVEVENFECCVLVSSVVCVKTSSKRTDMETEKYNFGSGMVSFYALLLE